MSKVTPWFPLGTNPERVGIYEVETFDFEPPNFRYWNGRTWGETFGWPTRLAEFRQDFYEAGSTRWRGLARKP